VLGLRQLIHDETFLICVHVYLRAYLCLVYTTSRNVADSRSDEVNGFNLLNPSGRTRPWGILSL
jgi:hypothetical protein